MTIKTLSAAALLALSLPAFAEAPAASTAPAASPPPAGSFAAPLAPLVPGSAAAALDALVGHPQIVGITTKSGAMFLGRVISGDHTNYLVQAFHFVGRPRTVSHTYGSGRYRRVVRSQEQTYLPDTLAVGYLLRGAAGSKINPPEAPAGSGALAASSLKCLQALSPPAKAARKAAAKRKPSDPAASASASPPAAPAPASPASKWSWTLTTLWPPAGQK